MRFVRTGILVLVVLLAVAAVGVAQTADDAHDVTIAIAGVATLELNDITTITLSTTAPAAGSAGDPVGGDSDNSKQIFYTLLTSAAQSITAEVDVDPPAGTVLNLEASNVLAANGTAVAGGVDLTIAGGAQDIITGITSTATTRVLANVPILTYTLSISNPSLLTIGNTTTTVTLTLTGP